MGTGLPHLPAELRRLVLAKALEQLQSDSDDDTVWHARQWWMYAMVCKEWRTIVRQSPTGLTLTYDIVGHVSRCLNVERQLYQLYSGHILLRSLRVKQRRGGISGGEDASVSAALSPSDGVSLHMGLLLSGYRSFLQRSGPHLQSVVLQHDGTQPFQFFAPEGSFPALKILHGVGNRELTDWESIPPQLESLDWTWIGGYAAPGDWGEQPCLQLQRLPNLQRIAARWVKGIGDPEPLLQQLPPGLRHAHFVFEDTVPWRMDVLGRWVSMAQRLPGMQAVMSSDKPPGCTSKTYISIELHRRDEQQEE